ncbi:hypothetical protein ScPMuIL_004329 [Solemya velum]
MPQMKEDDDDTFRILVTTDVHLGYGDKDAEIGNDSLVTFEEVLENAKRLEVDFILLGGDLFHENKPPRRVMHGCFSLFRKYCLGGKPVQFEFLSDQSVNFEHCQFPTLNYEDSNLNIGIPIFSIHGNHDDPTGQGNLCSLDLLHDSGYVNYFGKTTNLEKIQISPLLLQKGKTKLAMFGLGSVRDERLHRIFVHKNVSMLRPKEDKDDWFNMFVIHQNRSKHSATNYIPEQFLDDFLDLVIWGHEHECRIDPEWNGVQNFYVSQPGSTVATSLSEGETGKKHIGLLQIKEKDFKMTKIPLDTVRQFYLNDISLSQTGLDPEHHEVKKQTEAYCVEKVEELLDKAVHEHTGNRKQPSKPLIRLRIDYSGGFETFNSTRFGQKFVDRVANPKDMVLFHRKAIIRKKDSKDELSAMCEVDKEVLDMSRVVDMVKDYLSADQNCQMQLLTEKGMGEAVQEFVDKEEKEAISELVKYQLQKTQNYLKHRNAKEEDVDKEVMRYKEERKKKTGEEDEEVEEAMKRAREHRVETGGGDNDFSGTEDSDDMDTPLPTRGRGRGRARGTTRGKAKESTTNDSPARGRGSRSRGRARGGRNKAPLEMGSNSIMDSFRRTSQNSRGKASSKRRNDSDSDVQVLSADSNDSFDPFDDSVSRSKKASAKSSTSTYKKPTGGKRGVVFNSESDDDIVPTSKRRR